jgi:hypothetical protein
MNRKEKSTISDNEVINIHENYDVEHWAGILNIPPYHLREIVKKAGANVASVRAYLNSK